jgi:hypothetical protein
MISSSPFCSTPAITRGTPTLYGVRTSDAAFCRDAGLASPARSPLGSHESCNPLMKNRKYILAALIPVLVTVNGIALTGQALYIRDDWRWPVLLSIVTAFSIESVAVFFAVCYHDAVTSGDNALFLGLGSLGMGAIAATMNALHWASPDGGLTSKSYVLGALSFMSPILWRVFTRRVSRPRLIELGVIEQGAVRLGAMRWLLFTRDSFSVFKMAVWKRETRPDAAIAAWEAKRDATVEQSAALALAADAERLAIESRPTLDTAATQADRIRIALRESGEESAPAIAEWLAARGYPGVLPSYIRQLRGKQADRDAAERRDAIRAVSGTGSGR